MKHLGPFELTVRLADSSPYASYSEEQLREAIAEVVGDYLDVYVYNPKAAQGPHPRPGVTLRKKDAYA